MRHVALYLLCALVLLGAACGHALAPVLVIAPDCDDTPDPGVLSPLRHPV